MSNFEYDKLYDELAALEKETGIVMTNSPTVSVGYETLSELPKESHVAPMLSLGKTKEREELVAWLADKEGVLSLKLDGLSIILTYENGILVKALTRGNGEVGEVITNNAKTFQNIPAKIKYKERLVVRGEALIRYSDFEMLNRSMADIQEKYKNPRNLCSGTVRQLNNRITAERNVRFYAYQLVMLDDQETSFTKKSEMMMFLAEQGFDVVPYKKVDGRTVSEGVTEFSEEIMMILPTVRASAEQQNFPGTPLPLNGRMNWQRQHFLKWNGVHPVPDLSIQWRFLSRLSWRARQ